MMLVSCPLPASSTQSPGPASSNADRIASRRSVTASTDSPRTAPAATAPATICSLIASGSSLRGSSAVTMVTSATSAQAAPCKGRLVVSRSPALPVTTMRRPSGYWFRSSDRIVRIDSGVCA